MPHIPRKLRQPVPGKKPLMSKAPLASQPQPPMIDMDELPVVESESPKQKPEVGRKPVIRRSEKRLGIDKISLAQWDVLPQDLSD